MFSHFGNMMISRFLCFGAIAAMPGVAPGLRVTRLSGTMPLSLWGSGASSDDDGVWMI